MFPFSPGPQVSAFQLGAMQESPAFLGPLTHELLRANTSGIAVLVAIAAILRAVMIAKRIVLDSIAPIVS